MSTSSTSPTPIMRPLTQPVPGEPSPIHKSSVAATSPASPVPGAPAALLLPVRMETLVRKDADKVWLLVRIFPDQVHVNGFVPELTEQELTAGKRFWTQIWSAAPEDLEQLKVLAWQELELAYGLRRAGWIATVLTPLNWDLSTGTRAPSTGASTTSNSSASAGAAAGQGIVANPSEAPRFPIPPRLDESSSRVPHASLLPNAWTVQGFLEGACVFKATGKPIPPRLNLFRDPSLDAITDKLTGLVIDDGIAWQVDFSRAEAVGMALRIDVTQLRGKRLDRLIVSGQRASQGSSPSASEEWQRLLHAHLWTDGLSFIPQGTPTNRPEQDKGEPADVRSKKLLETLLRRPSLAPDGALSRLLETTGWGTPAVVKSAAVKSAAAQSAAVKKEDLTSSVLPGVLSITEQANLSEAEPCRWMNTALWRTTLGHYLDVMLKKTDTVAAQPIASTLFKLDTLNASSATALRSHFIHKVSGRGPFSAMRIGKQPYGVLPVLPLRELTASGKATPAQQLLSRLMEEWLDASQRVPHVRGDTSPAPGMQPLEQLVTQILSREALSQDFRLRPVLGGVVADALWSQVKAARASLEAAGKGERDRRKMDELEKKLNLLPSQPFRREGDDTKVVTLLAALGLEGTPSVSCTVLLRRQLKLDGPLVHEDPLAARVEFITSLLKSKVEDTVSSRKAPSLLQLLLRNALLDTSERVADQLLGVSAGQDSYRELLDSSLLSLLAKLTQPYPPDNKQTIGKALGAYLVNGTGALAQYVELKELREALIHLAELSAAQLEVAMQETLDLCSHRLDAWMTAQAWVELERRQKTLGTSSSGHLVIGGFGWLDALHIEPHDPKLNPLRGNQSAGYIHAPSLDQAAAGAILRAGHLSHRSQGNGDDAFAIDLSSRRVRLAEELLEGVRQGQPLAQLLGQRFERMLHALDLDVYLDDVRALAPLKLGEANKAAEACRPIGTDGLALHELWLSDPPKSREELWASLGNPPLEDQARLQGAFQVLDDALDAVDDALTAESVYQLMQGNAQKAGITLGAVARGDAPPPQLEVTRTHRCGVTLSHRAMLLCPRGTGCVRAWSSIATPRSSAEPGLNALLAALLQTSQVIGVTIQLRPVGTEQWTPVKVTLADLGIQPIDLMYLGGLDPQGRCKELERRLVYQARRVVAGQQNVDPFSLEVLELDAEEVGAGSPLAQVLERARVMRALLGRALEPRDLVRPEQSPTSTVNASELQGRVKALEDLLPKSLPASTDPGALRESLLTLSLMGNPTLLPDVPNAGLDALRARAEAWLSATRKSLQNQTTDVARIQTVLGEEFQVLPLLTGQMPEFGGSEQLLAAEPYAALEWVQRMGAVRPELAKLEDAMLQVEELEAAQNPTSQSLKVAQLPGGEQPLNRWIGSSLPTAEPPTADVLSLVAWTPAPLKQPLNANATEFSGVLIDEWSEVLPLKELTTGVALHFNAPDSQPPHALLVGVLPPTVTAWTDELLVGVVQQAADTARIRSVDHSALRWELRHLLPAIALPHSPAPDVLTSEFNLFV